MMEGWEKYTFSKVTSLITKGTTPSTYGFDFIPDGEVNFIRAEGISKEGYIDESTFLRISFECDEKLKRSKIKEDDILFSIAGMALGKSGIVKKDFLPANTNQAVAILRPNSLVHPKFLLYYVVNPSFYKLVNSVSGQAAQPNINLAQIGLLPIYLPPLPTQRKIASILSAYDDLIENNLKRIKLLEEKAQLTYEEWFVRMKFPGHETTPINKETGLPEGWERKMLGDLGEIITGKTPSTAQEDYYGGNIPFIKTPDMSGFPYVLETNQNLTEKGSQTQHKKVLPKNSLVVSCIGSAGAYALVSRKSQFNQQINAIKFSKEEYTFYAYCHSRGLKPILDALGSNGATMTNVNKGKFEKIDIILPNEELLLDFHTGVKLNFEVILLIMKQNQLLKEARDLLLPRLMSGMLDPDEIVGTGVGESKLKREGIETK